MRDEGGGEVLFIPHPSSHIPHPFSSSQLCLMLEGELHQRMAAVQFEFGGDVVPVMLDGADSDAQFSRDCTARLAFSDQLQDAAFGGG